MWWWRRTTQRGAALFSTDSSIHPSIHPSVHLQIVAPRLSNGVTFTYATAAVHLSCVRFVVCHCVCCVLLGRRGQRGKGRNEKRADGTESDGTGPNDWPRAATMDRVYFSNIRTKTGKKKTNKRNKGQCISFQIWISLLFFHCTPPIADPSMPQSHRALAPYTITPISTPPHTSTPRPFPAPSTRAGGRPPGSASAPRCPPLPPPRPRCARPCSPVVICVCVVYGAT